MIKLAIFCILNALTYIFLGYFMEHFLKIKEFWIYGFTFYILGFFSALMYMYIESCKKDWIKPVFFLFSKKIWYN